MATFPKQYGPAYGAAYRRARETLLANHPFCHWCGDPATTADHEPPLRDVGRPHLNLVPACEPCNKGRQGGGRPFKVAPSREW